MLIRKSAALSANSKIVIEKYTDTEDASLRGAFSESENVTWVVKTDREFGVRDVIMRIHRDGDPYKDIPLAWTGDGEHSVTLKMADLGVGLFFYTFLLLRGGQTIFISPYDNVNFNIVSKPDRFFMLTVYDKNFTTPEWFHGGTMYQIFPDRFRKSGFVKEERDDAVYEKNWSAPISQYSLYPGGPLENNLFYGGDLYGVAEKLDYLRDMGVSVIYLNPIFKAYSNHRYDTGDYLKIDDGLGGERAFKNLITQAERRGMKVILDGVFNHTGDNSKYFNRHGKYDTVGAWQGDESPYRNWYNFYEDNTYDCWWGIGILPRLNHENEECRKYFTADDGVCAKYARMNLGGWRLDVADELSDKFLFELRSAVKKANPEAVIIGEVWENAADKVAYGYRRHYVQGKQLDSVMNYPFRTSAINFVMNGNSADLANTLTMLYASYPKCVSDSLMNIVGTHDTERILSVLGDSCHGELSNSELSVRKMCAECRDYAVSLLKILSVIQYTVYGVPSLYYGDEAGMEGYHDPFCRETYPWGRENEELLAHYRLLGELRKNNGIFAEGKFRVLKHNRGFIMFERYDDNERLVICANVNKNRSHCGVCGVDLLSGERIYGCVSPMSAVVIKPDEI